MFYIFSGNDQFTIAETVAHLRQRLAAVDPMADLNVSDLDGRALTVSQLRTTADALPFLGQRRLVVVHGLLGRCNPRSGDRGQRQALADGLVGYLPHLSPATRLVFVDERLDRDNPVRRWAEGWLATQPVPAETGVVREFAAPAAATLPHWLARRAAAAGWTIETPAAVALADVLVRDGAVDLRLADTELAKLATYAAGRPVTAQDVATLVTPVSIESIFRLVDALAARDGPTAATLLHQFLAVDEPPLRLLTLVTRQFRLLLQAHALADAETPPGEVPGRLGVPPFVARKLLQQCRGFNMSFLVAAVHRLRDIDTEIKTGQIDPVLALDLFVAGVCGTARAAR